MTFRFNKFHNTAYILYCDQIINQKPHNVLYCIINHLKHNFTDTQKISKAVFAKMAQLMDKSTKYRILGVSRIDDVMIAVEKEKTGKGNEKGLLNETESVYGGESFEISKTIDIEQVRKKREIGTILSSKVLSMGDYEFDIQIYPHGDIKHKDQEEKTIGIYLNIRKRPSSVKSTTVSWTFSVYSENGTKIADRSIDHMFEDIQGWGNSEFITFVAAKLLKGDVSFRADYHISKEITIPPVQKTQLFARLDKLDHDLASGINAMPSNHYLLSNAFRQSFKHQAKSYHSKIDKASIITSDIATNVRSRLRKDFPKSIQKYINDIHASCYDTLTKVIKAAVNDG